jgi:hypothetical protein
MNECFQTLAETIQREPDPRKRRNLLWALLGVMALTAAGSLLAQARPGRPAVSAEAAWVQPAYGPVPGTPLTGGAPGLGEQMERDRQALDNSLQQMTAQMARDQEALNRSLQQMVQQSAQDQQLLNGLLYPQAGQAPGNYPYRR